jgi:hypothetical protein
VPVLERNLHRHAALSPAHVDERAVLPPWERLRHSAPRAQAQPSHGLEKSPEFLRIAIDCFKEVTSLFSLVLWHAGAEALSERIPEAEEPLVRHFEDAADVSWLISVEEEIGLRRVAVLAGFPVEHAERHERVQEILDAPFVDAHGYSERVFVPGPLGKFGEEP